MEWQFPFVVWDEAQLKSALAALEPAWLALVDVSDEGSFEIGVQGEDGRGRLFIEPDLWGTRLTLDPDHIAPTDLGDVTEFAEALCAQAGGRSIDAPTPRPFFEGYRALRRFYTGWYDAEEDGDGFIVEQTFTDPERTHSITLCRCKVAHESWALLIAPVGPADGLDTARVLALASELTCATYVAEAVLHVSVVVPVQHLDPDRLEALIELVAGEADDLQVALGLT